MNYSINSRTKGGHELAPGILSRGQKIQGGLDGHGTPNTLKTASLDLHDYHKCHSSNAVGSRCQDPLPLLPLSRKIAVRTFWQVRIQQL